MAPFLSNSLVLVSTWQIIIMYCQKDVFNNRNTNIMQRTTERHSKPVQCTLYKNYIRRKCPKEEWNNYATYGKNES